ncbi:MAG: GHKL domain-containing protein [Lachnospiraceae bacterium]|nr:GHKL domain-containing protein [Lachnospiraceae bacterium]
MWFQITPIPVVTSFFFLWSTPVSRTAILTQRVRKVSLFLFPLLLLFIWVIYLAFYRITRHIIKNAEIENENHLLQLQEKRYRELRDYMDSTRTLRHDFRQHLLVLDGLSKNREFSKLSEYLDSIIEITNVSFDHFATNSAVDAIAAYYDSRLRELNAEIIWRINLPESLPISESDLCSVLGNLLENATNALSLEPEENRSIKIVSGMLSSAMLGISVENSYSGKPISENNHYYPSLKDNYSEHGIGLSSVYATVRKYNGTMDLKVDNGVFSADIIFYSPCQATETAAEIV